MTSSQLVQREWPHTFFLQQTMPSMVASIRLVDTLHIDSRYESTLVGESQSASWKRLSLYGVGGRCRHFDLTIIHAEHSRYRCSDELE